MENSLDLFVPESHHGKTLQNVDWKKLPKIRGLVDKVLGEKVQHGLFLFGDPGIGKTHIMVGMFRAFVEKGYVVGQDVIYMQWSDLVTEVVEVLKTGSIPETIIDRLMQVKVLLIDDVRPGWGRVWNDCLKRIVEKVYEKRVKLVMSANVEDVNDMVVKWQFEDYWLSRMREIVQFVKMKGEDRRRLGGT